MSIGLSVQEKKRIKDIEDGGHVGLLGFPIGTSLASFDLQHPDASYQVSNNRPFGQDKKEKKMIFQIVAMAAILDF